MDYDLKTVEALIVHRDIIESFLESSTSELFSVQYSHEDSNDFFMQEGNTLNNNGPHNTRVPNKNGLRENLMVMLADLDRAMMCLTLEERLTVLYQYTIYEGKKGSKSEYSALEALSKMVAYLNNAH